MSGPTNGAASEVGRERDERHRAERRRAAPAPRRSARRWSRRAPRGTTPVRAAGGAIGAAPTAIPAHAPHESRKPDRVEQERIDDEQPESSRSASTRPASAGRPSQRASITSPAMARGAQHRRLPARHRAEHREDREPADETRGEAPPAQHRLGDRQRERDVRARHREQVAEAGGAEVVDEIRRDRAGVAEDEAGEQRTRVWPGACSAPRSTTSACRVGHHEPGPVRARDGVDPLDRRRRRPRGATAAGRRSPTAGRAGRGAASRSPASSTRSALCSSPAARSRDGAAARVAIRRTRRRRRAPRSRTAGRRDPR